jgi:hypothetical protein
MRSLLNYEKDTRDTELIDWNRKMNYEDMKHDASGKLSTQLFKKIINTLYRSNKPKEPYSVYFEHINYDTLDEPDILPYILPLPRGTQKKKPSQLHGFEYIIHDTFSIDSINMPERITPSYYLDPATRDYDDTKPGTFSKLKNYCRGIIGTDIDLSKYGIEYKMKINFETFNNQEVLKILLKKNNIDYLYVLIDKNGDPLKCHPDNEIDIIIDENGKPQSIYYIRGNNGNKLFLEKYKNNNTNIILEQGIKLLICKLLGDLSHVIFSSDKDIVCTIDSYLVERCIKNKVPIIHKVIKNKIPIFYFMPIQSNDYLNQCTVLNQKQKHDNDDIRGGNPTSEENNIFANDSNKINVKNYIDNYVTILNNFLKEPVFVNKYVCTNEALNYINQLIVFLNSKVKNEIEKIDTNQSVNEFNSKIMKWFPLDIIVETNDIIREGPKYFIPTKITKIFPELGDTIDNFVNKIPFNNFSIQNFEIEKNDYSLKDILNYLSNKFNQSRESDEVIKCKKIIEQLNNKNEIFPKDLFELIDICIYNSFIHEDIILFEYLLYICKYDMIEAYTYYNVLLQLTYIDGYYICNYNIINEIVENVKKPDYIFTGGYNVFKSFLIKHMNSETHEEKINQEINPPETLVSLPETNTQNLDDNKENETIFPKFNPHLMYDNLKQTRIGKEIAAGKKNRNTKKTNLHKKQNKHRNKTHKKMSKTLSKKKK